MESREEKINRLRQENENLRRQIRQIEGRQEQKAEEKADLRRRIKKHNQESTGSVLIKALLVIVIGILIIFIIGFSLCLASGPVISH